MARHHWNTSRRRLHLRHRPPLVLPIKTHLLLFFYFLLCSSRPPASTCNKPRPGLPGGALSAGQRGQRLPLVRGLHRPQAAAPRSGRRRIGSEGLPEDLHGYSHAHSLTRGRESTPAPAHPLPVLAARASYIQQSTLMKATCRRP